MKDDGQEYMHYPCVDPSCVDIDTFCPSCKAGGRPRWAPIPTLWKNVTECGTRYEITPSVPVKYKRRK